MSQEDPSEKKVLLPKLVAISIEVAPSIVSPPTAFTVIEEVLAVPATSLTRI